MNQSPDPGKGESGETIRAAEARRIADATLFAARAHAGQVREDSGEPYVNHLAEVAAFLSALEPFDPVLVTAAWLHDVVEDTAFTLDDIQMLFGSEVAELVSDVTDPPGIKGKARRDRQVTHTRESGPRVKLLKLADKTSNVEELIGLPADRFDRKGNERYLKWARRVVDVCRGLAPDLEARFDRSAETLDAEIAEAKAREKPVKHGQSKPSRRKGTPKKEKKK
ncbi:MAG: phosphohydrolase [Phyllobacteriaceae bacterium]|nr:phosphohydrolase [Phyllobacteriaceae bacterium]MBA92543.1 phosphohydrolase [Phyllobacteriaceae bacterium]